MSKLRSLKDVVDWGLCVGLDVSGSPSRLKDTPAGIRPLVTNQAADSNLRVLPPRVNVRIPKCAVFTRH